MSFRVFMLPLLFGITSVLPSTRAEEHSELSTMKKQFEELRVDANLPIEEFQKKYEAALEKLKASAQAEGNLAVVIAAQEEMDGFRTGSKRSTNPELARLQKIYADGVRPLLIERNATVLGLMEAYRRNLTELKDKMTREGQIEGALRVQSELTVILAEIDKAASEAAVAELPEFAIDLKKLVTSGGCRTTHTDEGLEMTAPAGENYVHTMEEFSPPIRITVVAKTDSSNIRLWYGKGRLIFNWEENYDSLRVRDPLSGGGKGIAGKGRLKVNEFYTFEWEILDDEMKVKLNGKTLHEEDGDFEDLKASVGIGPGFNSRVTVRSIVVEPLAGR